MLVGREYSLFTQGKEMSPMPRSAKLENHPKQRDHTLNSDTIFVEIDGGRMATTWHVSRAFIVSKA